MRTEEEMFQLILATAQKDDRIRCVYLNGSRSNPNIKKDPYQDFDIVYVVTETTSFLSDPSWLESFGEIAMMQEPNAPKFGWGETQDSKESYTWLMLFKDGNRIELHLDVKETALKRFLGDTLTVKLLDKENFLPEIPKATDETHWIKKPSKAEFLGCCNEFWWCLNNVGKGLMRNQLPYAMRMYHETSHSELDKMIEWSIGLPSHFQIATGLWGKSFKELLSEKDYDRYLQTYSKSEKGAIWQSIFTAMELFKEKARAVALDLDYSYNLEEETNMTLYLEALREISIINESKKEIE